ncbi:GNAT family N-acetyltransferase [Haladaptatus caseinilyticus]|uniref:GNAT family N-acetyltransferase n=1 Tax=Haladaptatus caseinilyticus TaxID=2993314 RepID=UPI00224B81B8|nr:GNAT family protein [Haladaptatus caseinilyticus]
MQNDLFPTDAESERLRYEPFHESVEILDLYEHHRSGEMDVVMRPLGENPHATPKATMDELQSAKEAWESGERATYTISSKSDGEFVGVAEQWLEWDKRRASFGMWIREPFWGRGCSSERAGTMSYVAFEWLDLDLVSVGHDPENEQSRRAIEKYVDAYCGQHDAVLRNWLPSNDFGDPTGVHVYSILQEQWRENVTTAEIATIRVGA